MTQLWTISEPSSLLGMPLRMVPEKPQARPSGSELFDPSGQRPDILASTPPRAEAESTTPLSRLLDEQGGIQCLIDTLHRETADRGYPASDFQKDMEWLRIHQGEYAGQWVALAGGRLLAAGNSVQAVMRQANQRGVQLPLVVKVADPETPAFGGW